MASKSTRTPKVQISSSMASKSTRIPQVNRFRALILGRANAGKTTILKSICGSSDDPIINEVAPSAERGEHNINHELIFQSNPHFVFHDSKGFECGSEDEVEIMNKFIDEKANATTLDEKLHAIWYCIPTDDPRLVTAAEENFFDKCDPQGVPVILLFTKFDALDGQAFHEITSAGMVEGMHTSAEKLAEEKFSVHLLLFKSRKYPPKGIIYIRCMNDEDEVDTIKCQCSKIIEATTENLTSDTLKHLLISVQQVNIKLCVHYAIKSSKGSMNGQLNVREALQQVQSDHQGSSRKERSILWKAVLAWFPHAIFVRLQFETN